MCLGRLSVAIRGVKRGALRVEGSTASPPALHLGSDLKKVDIDRSDCLFFGFVGDA
jgi:hypothetical protein